VQAKAIAGICIGVAIAVISGLVIYYSVLPPNILISEINIDSFEDEKRIKIVDLGRVSVSDSFSYYSKNGGQYYLNFDNSFSIISDKSVSVSYTDKGKTYQENLFVPAGIYKTIQVFANPGTSINGEMQIRGGSGNDVNFNIQTTECKQRVDFSFTLLNSGHVNGDATVMLISGEKYYWSNNYVLKPEEKISRSDSVTLANCNHDLRLIISEQENTDYFGSLFK